MNNGNWYPEAGSYGSIYQPQPAQQDNSAQLLAGILPILTTLPAIQAGEVNSKALSAELAAIPVPAVAQGGNPTKAEYDALRDYTIKCESVLSRHIDTASAVYAAHRQQVLFGMLTTFLAGSGNGGAAGNTTMILLVVMMAMFFR